MSLVKRRMTEISSLWGQHSSRALEHELNKGVFHASHENRLNHFEISLCMGGVSCLIRDIERTEITLSQKIYSIL